MENDIDTINQKNPIGCKCSFVQRLSLHLVTSQIDVGICVITSLTAKNLIIERSVLLLHEMRSIESHEFYETLHSVTFYFMKKTPNDTVTPQRQSQFTPKMKANAEPRLLSSLV